MSYIADIRAIFIDLYPSGTFMFTSEVRVDDKLRNIEASAFPLMVIDDSITETTSLNQDSSALDNINLKGFMLTAFDLSDERVVEGNSNKYYQHEQCITPMKDLAIKVMAKYFNSGLTARIQGTRPTIRTTDEYNIFGKMLYGVSFTPSNLNLRRVINYCDRVIPSTSTYKSTDVPGVDIDPSKVPTANETIKL